MAKRNDKLTQKKGRVPIPPKGGHHGDKKKEAAKKAARKKVNIEDH